jgi:2-polyprenyl-3-methyl-5-hydroxy-6-metoxy-1,4-benzoquinol methylase
MNATRFVRSARSRAEATTVVAGVRPYRRRYDLEPAKWDADYASGSLDHYGDIRQRSRYAVLAGYVEDARPRTILDLGCGVGLLRGYLEHVGFERFVGIDPSEVAVEQGNGSGFSRTQFKVGLVPDGTYDVIICNEMLYYVEDLDDLFARITASLSESGRLVTSIYKHPGDFALHHLLAKRFRPIDTVDLRSTVSKHRWKLGTYAAR